MMMLVVAVGLPLACTAVGLAVELVAQRGRMPAGHQLWINLGVLVLTRCWDAGFRPLLFFWVAYLTQAWGGLGIIPVPDQPWLAFIVVFVAGDLLRYWEHRAAHRWWWPLHSLHHSDPALTAASATRVHILESQIHRLVVSVPLLVLFRAPPEVFAMVSGVNIVVTIWAHLNLRLHLGPLTKVVIGPQMHRIHHSRLPQHIDCNFASVFPVWDALFGTYCVPRQGEFPETGLIDGRVPASLAAAMIWPLVPVPPPTMRQHPSRGSR